MMAVNGVMTVRSMSWAIGSATGTLAVATTAESTAWSMAVPAL
jgi:predicted S18 family serine protease